jgi:Cullin family
LVMEIIRKDRDGDGVADRFQLRDITTMMLEISKQRTYIEHFEKRFLRESQEYYTAEAQLFFERCTATDYLRKVKQRLKEERDRAQRTMDPDTRPKIE